MLGFTLFLSSQGIFGCLVIGRFVFSSGSSTIIGLKILLLFYVIFLVARGHDRGNNRELTDRLPGLLDNRAWIIKQGNLIDIKRFGNKASTKLDTVNN